MTRLRTTLSERYTIERELGRGGMATVYLARDRKHDRAVALKVLKPDLAASIGPDRFLREIRLTASLHHPHILPLYDSGQTDGFLYYVMPLVEGESLRDRLTREKQLPVDDALQIAREVADALGYAHSRGLIHRDIKPENILLAGDHALVSDFGIARAVSAAGGETLTETGLAIGTPAYMSPEQAAGTRELDGRSDLYALGCVVYEMLAGQPPFTGPTVESVIHQHLAVDPPDLVGLRPTVPAALAAAVRRALAKAPADRFTTASRFADALTSEPVLAEQGLRITAKPSRRLPGGAIPWAIAFLMTVAALWGWLRPRPIPPQRTVRSQILVSREGQDLAVQGRMALSPDGSLLVYRDSAPGGTQLYLRPLGDLQARPLPGTAGANEPFFSPDGRWVGFNRSGDLLKVGVDGGAPVTVIAGVGWAPGATWLPDGTIVYSDNGVRLVRVASDGTGARTIAELSAHHPDALPAGDEVLVVVAPPGIPSGEIAAVSLATGAVSRLGIHGSRPRYLPPGFVVFQTGGDVVAVPFDAHDRRVTGPPITIAQGPLRGSFTVSSSTLIYQRAVPADRSTLAWVSRDGRVTETDSGWMGELQTVALSPDGTRVAVSLLEQYQEHVWIKDLAGGSRSKMTLEGVRNTRPAWIPDGSAITFVSSRGDNGVMRLYRQPSDGRRAAELLLDVGRGIWEAVWSHDGLWMILRQDGFGAYEDLYAIRPGVDTVARELVITSVDQEWNASLSPNGEWFAFTSDETDRAEIYVRPFPDVTGGRWMISTDGGTEPIWSRDGREIFYRSGTSQMIAAAVTIEPTFRVLERRVLFDASDFQPGGFGRAYDVHPDGTRFIMIRTGRRADAPEELILVQNFVEELIAAQRGRGAAPSSRQR